MTHDGPLDQVRDDGPRSSAWPLVGASLIVTGLLVIMVFALLTAAESKQAQARLWSQVGKRVVVGGVTGTVTTLQDNQYVVLFPGPPPTSVVVHPNAVTLPVE